jgi:hypothetical protein
MQSCQNSIISFRVPVGPKILSDERHSEAFRLQRLLETNNAFSFIRVGDFEFALLENGEDPHEGEASWSLSGTKAYWSSGLNFQYRDQLLESIRKADFVDFLDLNWPEDFEPLLRYRTMAKSTCSCYPNSYISGTWMERHFKEYCRGRRVLFCGAEAPILENLCRDTDYLKAASEFYEPGEGTFFLRPREDGRNLANNLQGIREDIIDCVRKNRIDTVFLSLGAGAKILCVDLARDLGIHAIDFGAGMRSLCYAGSEGLRATRAPHHIFLFRVPFLSYMEAVQKAFTNLKPEEILAKAHAQLLLEVQKKEVGWTCDSFSFDFSKSNLENFKRSFSAYRQSFKNLFNFSSVTQKERKDFLHFCGKYRLTAEGLIFHSYFNLKSTIATWLRKL